MTEHTDQSTGVDLREFVRPIVRYRELVLAIVVVATVATYVYNDRKPPQFRSSTQLFVQASEVDQSLFGTAAASAGGDRNIENQANLLRTPAVAEATAKRIGFTGDPSELLDAIAVEPAVGSDFLVVSAVSDEPGSAAAIANGFAATFVDLRASETRHQIQRALDAARRQLAKLPVTQINRTARETLRTRISSLEAIQSLSPGGARQVDRAAPGPPFAPRPRRAALFGFALSLVLAMLVAFGLERMDRRVRRVDDVVPAYGAPVLASLPHLRSGTASRHNGQSPEIVPPFREQVRGLRTNLRLASPDDPLRTLLVTSALPGEGKSTLVVNLALAYADAGLRVAILECDLRQPSMAKLIPVSPAPGLTEVLAGECELESAVQRVAVSTPVTPPASVGPREREPTGVWVRDSAALTVLTAGASPADPSSLLATQRMRRVLESARDDVDIVVVDTAPLLSVADALPLVGLVDATILVARVGTAHEAAGRRVREIIDRTPGASLIGIVVNDVPASDFASEYYGYGSAGSSAPTVTS